MKKFLFLLGFVWLFVPPVQAETWLNEQLPDWIEVSGQVRHRYEWRSDFDFNKALDDEKGFHLWRTRLNITLKPVQGWKFFYQFQDSRISHDSISGSKAGFENWADHRQLWIEGILSPLRWEAMGLQPIMIRMGRQEFSYGAQRLLGGFNWSNVAQTFDGGKVILDFDKGLHAEFFSGGKTPNRSPRERDDFYDGGSNDRLAGAYFSWQRSPNFRLEPYVIQRDSQGKTVSFGQTGDGEVEDYTIGFRVKGNLSSVPLDYELEAARQVGNSGILDVDAQMAVMIVGYTWDYAWEPRLSFEFDYASGDTDSSDGKRETFDNLYPTNHGFYGYMDFVSLQNINNYHFKLCVYPNEKMRLNADYHLIYLDSPKDNLYSAGRGIKRATSPGADAYVGSELDLTARFAVKPQIGFLAGYSHFFAGDFLDDTGPSDDADFFYVQSMLNF